MENLEETSIYRKRWGPVPSSTWLVRVHVGFTRVSNRNIHLHLFDVFNALCAASIIDIFDSDDDKLA